MQYCYAFCHAHTRGSSIKDVLSKGGREGSLIACGRPQLGAAQRLAVFLVTPTVAVLNGPARRLLSVAPFGHWCDTTEQSEHF